MRCFARHLRLTMHFADIPALAEKDDSLLAPRRRDCMLDNSLSTMRAACIRFQGLPRRGQDLSSLQSAVQRHLERSRAVGELQ